MIRLEAEGIFLAVRYETCFGNQCFCASTRACLYSRGSRSDRISLESRADRASRNDITVRPRSLLNARRPIHIQDHTGSDVSGEDKRGILLKTPTQTFCKGCAFTLVDGKIYYSGHSDEMGSAMSKSPNCTTPDKDGSPALAHARIHRFDIGSGMISAVGYTLYRAFRRRQAVPMLFRPYYREAAARADW